MSQKLNISSANFEEADLILSIWLEAAYWLQSKGIEQWNPIDFSLDKVRERFERA